MSDILRTTERIARRCHRCEWCGTVISPGAAYFEEAAIFEGEFQAYDLHPECAAARDRLNPGEFWYSGDQPRGATSAEGPLMTHLACEDCQSARGRGDLDARSIGPRLDFCCFCGYLRQIVVEIDFPAWALGTAAAPRCKNRGEYHEASVVRL